MQSYPRRNAKGFRKHLLEAELDCLIKAAGEGRHGVRDRAMALVCYYHAFRASELCGLAMEDLDLDNGSLYARRLKRSRSGAHPVNGDVLKALRRWLAIRPKTGFRNVFIGERGDPLTRDGFRYLVQQWGERACIPFRVYPHMLRHTCGVTLANRPNGSKDLLLIRDYMGHRNVRSTEEYVHLVPGRFDDLWGI